MTSFAKRLALSIAPHNRIRDRLDEIAKSVQPTTATGSLNADDNPTGTVASYEPPPVREPRNKRRQQKKETARQHREIERLFHAYERKRKAGRPPTSPLEYAFENALARKEEEDRRANGST